MIDEKKIEEAARDYADDNCIPTDPCHYASQYAFKAGINWFKNNLWHDAYENPKEDACIIVQSNLGGEYYTSVYSNGEFECDSFHLLHKEITRWLYIEDLMKGGK